jgi:CMP-N-acetylneuraminic acid synthetase
MLVVIPARAGSKRIPGKSLRRLGGHPLLAYTIASAQELRDASRVIVASEDDQILACAQHYGADIWRRPTYTATDDAADITWLVPFVLTHVGPLEAFVLRRLTSPFVTSATIVRAWIDFQNVPEATALRAMRPCTEHPNKQWFRQGRWVIPLVNPEKWNDQTGVEAWSTPTQELRRVYVQTAGLEILKAETIRAGSLTGDRVMPWFFTDEQALDINNANDWWTAERLIDAGAAELPNVTQDPWVAHD